MACYSRPGPPSGRRGGPPEGASREERLGSREPNSLPQLRRPHYHRFGARLRRSRQRQFPELPDKVAPEAAVWLLTHQAKGGGLVDMAGSAQHVVGPQRDLAIAPLAGKADALGDEPAADPEPPRRGLDIEQTQFGLLVALFDEEYGTGDRTLALGDPAALAVGVEILDERRRDPRAQRLEGLVEAVFLGFARS